MPNQIFLATNITDSTPEHKRFYARLIEAIQAKGYGVIDLYDADVFGSGRDACRALYSRMERMIEKSGAFVSTDSTSNDCGVMLGIARRLSKPWVVLKPKDQVIQLASPLPGEQVRVVSYSTQEEAIAGMLFHLREVLRS